jgi:hypothetical protein
MIRRPTVLVKIRNDTLQGALTGGVAGAISSFLYYHPPQLGEILAAILIAGTAGAITAFCISLVFLYIWRRI